MQFISYITSRENEVTLHALTERCSLCFPSLVSVTFCVLLALKSLDPCRWKKYSSAFSAMAPDFTCTTHAYQYCMTTNTTLPYTLLQGQTRSAPPKPRCLHRCLSSKVTGKGGGVACKKCGLEGKKVLGTIFSIFPQDLNSARVRFSRSPHLWNTLISGQPL